MVLNMMIPHTVIFNTWKTCPLLIGTPVFWENEETAISQELNKFLTGLFFKLLSLAESPADRKDISQMKQSIQKEIDDILTDLNSSSIEYTWNLR